MSELTLSAILLDAPESAGSKRMWLATCKSEVFAVVDSKGHIWAVRPTHLGATRVADYHRRQCLRATNHYAHEAHVTQIQAQTIREMVLEECRTVLRLATEAECSGRCNGGLDSVGAKDALRVLRHCGNYAEWHASAAPSKSESNKVGVEFLNHRA